MKIELTNLANHDIDTVYEYVKQDNPRAASRIVQRVLEAIEFLAEMPAMGRPGRLAQTRELVVGGTPLIVIYRVKQQTVYILRILHAARKWPS